MDHPAAEIVVPFDGSERRLGVPPATTQFYWGAVGIETDTPRDGFELVRRRLDCTLELQDRSRPLCQEFRRHDGCQECAVWTAVDPPSLPVTATVTLTMGSPPPSVDGHARLRTHDGRALEWTETVRTTVELVPTDDCQQRTEQLWGRHDVYVPETV